MLPLDGFIGGARRVEVEFLGAAIRRDAQVVCAANISAELERVVAAQIRPVIDELN